MIVDPRWYDCFMASSGLIVRDILESKPRNRSRALPGPDYRSGPRRTIPMRQDMKNQKSNMPVRYFLVYWDRETPEHAGAEGLSFIESLMEGGKDVSNLVDQSLFFSEEEARVGRLRKLLAKNLGCSIDEIEIDEPDEG